jgi:hypothetical protein
VVKLNDGQLYRVVTVGNLDRVVTVGNLEGKGEMKGYANTLDVTDRWAVVAYLRALQLSRLGLEEEVPERFHVKAKSADNKSEEQENH